MSTARRIVVVGGGPAGVAAALAARQQDAAAEVVLLSDEHHEPYEKPPLSKAVLTGKATPHDAPIAGPNGVAGGGVAFERGVRVTAIDRAVRAVVTQSGARLGYDALVLATGSINRVLPMFVPGSHGIYYLRTEAEARALKAHLDRSKSLLVIGGGVIGLEVAASAAELGVATTVIEIAPRILARVCDEETSAIIHARHRARGVDIRVGAAASALRTLPDGRLTVEAGAGETLTADLIAGEPAPRPTTRWRRRRGSPCRTASSLTTTAARMIPRSSPPATAPAFPGRTARCGWRTGVTPRSTAPSPPAMPPAPTSPTTSRPRSGQSNSTCTSRAWAGRSRHRARVCAGRSPSARRCCSSSTAPTSPMPWASTRSATSPWRAG